MADGPPAIDTAKPDPLLRDTPVETLRAAAAAFILAFEVGLRPGGELRYEGPGFVLSLRATSTKH